MLTVDLTSLCMTWRLSDHKSYNLVDQVNELTPISFERIDLLSEMLKVSIPLLFTTSQQDLPIALHHGHLTFDTAHLPASQLSRLIS